MLFRSAESEKILMGLRPYYEDFHGVKYQPSAISAAVELSARHINDRFLPDKAIDVIDEAGAIFVLSGEKKRRKSVTRRDVEEVVARMARIPSLREMGKLGWFFSHGNFSMPVLGGYQFFIVMSKM